jgi:hypothetical protein
LIYIFFLRGKKKMTQPTKWSAPLGSGADVQDLPDDDLKYASFSKIFPQITQVPLSAGGVAPRRIDFNSLFKLLADNIYYYQNGGVFEYSDTADYEKGALVRYNDKIYLCIQDNSALNAHNPEDMDYWLRVALNNELADYLPLVGGNVTGNLSVQNKNVVRSVNGVEANEIGNVQLDGLVKSVNGVNADASGNVTIQTDNFAPDYNASVSKLANTTYTATCNGWVACTESNGLDFRFTMNGVAQLDGILSVTGNNSLTLMFPIGKGDTYACTANFIFYPCKGAN